MGHGNTYCGKTRKCSKWSWCGTSSAYNNGYSKFDGNKVPSRCLAKPAPRPTNCASYKITKDQRCGPKFGNTYCGKNRKCSKWSWCGTSSAYNNGYSKFDGNKVPSRCLTKPTNCASYKITKNQRCGPRHGNTYCG